MEMKISGLRMDTKSYKDFLKILDTVKNDTWQLFDDMNNFNKYSKNIREDFIKSLGKVERKLLK